MFLIDIDAISEMMAEFSPTEDEIADFLLAHDVSPAGAVDISVIMADGASRIEPPTIRMAASLHLSGILLGLHLADERAKLAGP